MAKQLAIFALMISLIFTVFSGNASAQAAEKPGPVYETDILPILKASCLRCHGKGSSKAELNLSTAAGLFKGGESGVVVKPGDLEESLLLEMITDGSMPPEDAKEKPLTKKQIALIRQWIDTGARSKLVSSNSLTPAVTQHDVIPILLRRCAMCHGPEYQEGGLTLLSKATMLKGGKSGPAIVVGKPEDSLLLEKLLSDSMPPKADRSMAGIEPPTKSELETLTSWIAAGAPEVTLPSDVAVMKNDPLVTEADRQFWSFRPPVTPKVPQVKNATRVRNELDAFLLRKLEEKQLGYSPEADRLTLLRRATFALTGLPPTPDEIKKFLSDKRDDAYEHLIDRLLDSPNYGEKWGRFWLDLAGYSDSDGKRQADMVRSVAYRYRDYVIRAFNADKPYDQFLIEQLAGDELADYSDPKKITLEIIDNLIATGYLRMVPDGTTANPVNRVEDRLEVMADSLDIFSRGVMGLTMKCARCHSHKYDPLPQRDYYRLLAVFKGAYDEYDWMPPQKFGNQWKKSLIRYLNIETPEQLSQREKHNAALQSQIAEGRKELAKKTALHRKKIVDQRLAKLPAELHADLKKMLATPVAKRDAAQKMLAIKYEKQLRIDTKQLAKLDAAYKKLADTLNKKLKGLEGRKQQEPKIRALWDRGRPSITYIYRRGDHLMSDRPVEPAVPSALNWNDYQLEAKPPWPNAKSTGRRLAFARWLTQKDHPLTSRVIVNRVWKQHFGHGIVKTLDDFGANGERPLHPDLLDWLARQFVDQGWSFKNLHRTIMTSSAYRQVSAVSEQAAELDSENRLLSHMTMRRMTAEEIYDSTLFVASRLNPQPFGPPDAVTIRKDGLVTPQGVNNLWRRSIYVRQRRKEMPTMLETFDLPQMNPNCTSRVTSSVVSQSLHLLNNKRIYDLSDFFAQRVIQQSGTDRKQQISLAYMIALNRPPTPEETRLGRDAIQQFTQQRQQAQTESKQKTESKAEEKALADFCHILINSAAFSYID
jgi:hypothetical protein